MENSRDPMPTPAENSAQVLSDDERERALVAATDLLVHQGPSAVTLKWVAMNADVSADLVAATWPTVESVLDAVLERLSARYEDLTGGVLGAELAADEAAVIDAYQRIIARALLDGVNPASPERDRGRNDRWVKLFQAQFGLDDQGARLRLAQTFALEWGWRLFGPHIKLACGLGQQSDAELIDGVRDLEQLIIRLPPTEP